MSDWLKIAGFAVLAFVFMLRVFFGSEEDEFADGRPDACFGAQRFCE